MKVSNKSLPKKLIRGNPFHVKNKKSLKVGRKKTRQRLKKSKIINSKKNHKGGSSSENKLDTSKLIATNASVRAAGLPSEIANLIGLEVLKENSKPIIDEYIDLMNKAIYKHKDGYMTCDNNIMEKIKRDQKKILEIIELSEYDENSHELRQQRLDQAADALDAAWSEFEAANKEIDASENGLALKKFVLNNPVNDGGRINSVCSVCGAKGKGGLEYVLGGVSKDSDTGIYSADSIQLLCWRCAH